MDQLIPGAPEIGSTELHAIEVLRSLTTTVGVRVGEHERRMHKEDHAMVAAHVARKSRVTSRMEIECPHRLANSEARRVVDRLDWPAAIRWHRKANGG